MVLANLQEFNEISVVLRLVLAMVLGGLLGIERGRKKRPAGFRTYMTVCMSSALVMITGQFLYYEFNTGDPARLGAQVISGIGFLGVGTIMVTGRNQVKGLTTAAGLWAAACIGLTIGIGFYFAATVCSLLILFSMTVLHKFENNFNATSRVMDFFAEFKTMEDVGGFTEELHQNEIAVSDLQIKKRSDRNRDLIGCLFTIRLPMKRPHEEVLEMLEEFKGVRYIQEIT